MYVPNYSEWKSFGDNIRQIQPHTYEIQKDLQFDIVSYQECELPPPED
jgi:endonuclease/exonuclease/phosphatase family metal-dependent hydrolase